MQEATAFSMQFFTHFPSWHSSCFCVAATTPSIPTTSATIMTSCFTTLIFILMIPNLRLLTITVIICSVASNFDDTLYKCVLKCVDPHSQCIIHDMGS
ncbi:hypothetical protein LguiA_013039 [Lonicera macranthoides]